MNRRRPATVVSTLCVTAALIGAPVAAAQPAGSGARITVEELPTLRELPPLPADGVGPETTEEADESGGGGVSGIQTAALVLAGSVLVVGALGLAVVTGRGRGDEPEDKSDQPGPAGVRPSG